jgi:hypothetical protein
MMLRILLKSKVMPPPLPDFGVAITRKPSHFWQGIVFIVFFTCLAVASPVALRLEAPRVQDACSGTRELMVTAVTAFWSCWVVLGIWNLLDFFYHSIALSDENVRFAGIFGKRTIALAGIERVRWYGHYRLKLFSTAGSRVVWLGNYRQEQRNQLIRYFRERLPSELQDGWKDFVEYDRQHRSEMEAIRKRLPTLLKTTFVVGPLAGLGCGLFLHFFSESMNVSTPTWTCSTILDWVLLGFCIGPGLGLSLTLWIVLEAKFARITEGMERTDAKAILGQIQDQNLKNSSGMNSSGS